MRLSNRIQKADTDGDGKLSSDEVSAAKSKLSGAAGRRFDKAVTAGNGDVKASQNALSDAAVKAYAADRNHDGFVSGKELKSLDKGSLERSLFSRDHGAWDKGLEHRAMNASKLVSQGLTPDQVQKYSQSQVPAERMAAQAWQDGGGTVQGAQQQISQAISQIDQADTNGNGRVGPKEAAALTGSAQALFQATTALRGRF
ncbi:MAG: hypothetical protein QM723_22335 [Myxococcaceae bacterium]